MNKTTEQRILSAIELYVNEPQDLIRVIPDPEVLVDFIEDALRDETDKADVMAESLKEEGV